MDPRWTPFAEDSLKAVSVLLHLTASPLEVLRGESEGYDLSPFVQSGSQSSNEVSVTLRWHFELYGTNEPRPGQVLEVKLNEQTLWIGLVQSINDFQLSSGNKSMTVLARSRDTLPRWRDTRRATDIYPMSTPYQWIVQNIAEDLGLTSEEYDIPPMSAYTMQNNVQLADLTPWQMLTTIVEPLGLQPYVSATGVLKFISRDVTRPSDIVFDDNRRLVNVQGSKSKPTVTEVLVSWLDPKLTEVSQQDKVLSRENITAGFFQLHQRKDIQFSDDGTQRARNTHLVVRQSANSGLLPVCDEEYEQLSPTGGRITLTTSAWAPALVTVALGEMISAGSIPDMVGTPFAPTIPVGRLVHAAAEGAIMLVMMSIGTGQYEIWGTPYDSVHTRNKTSSYNPRAKDWEINVQEIENDFVTSEGMAQNMSTRELLYAYRSASSYNIKIVDDPRVEVGDIVELANGSRVYVTNYSRDLTSGSPAVLQIQGFNADYVKVSIGDPTAPPVPSPAPAPPAPTPTAPPPPPAPTPAPAPPSPSPPPPAPPPPPPPPAPVPPPAPAPPPGAPTYASPEATQPGFEPGSHDSGDSLTADFGAPLNGADTYTFVWMRDGADISGATGTTASLTTSRTLVSGDIGHLVSVRIYATNAIGNSEIVVIPGVLVS